jgi:hypothetical protein
MLRIVQSIATVKVVEGVQFGFGNTDANTVATLMFPPDLDRYNFARIPQETVIATLWGEFLQIPLRAWDEDNQDITDQFFDTRSSQIIAKIDLFPVMLTLDVQIIRQDCFCYLVKELDLL